VLHSRWRSLVHPVHVVLFTCILFVAADWWKASSCICMCVLWQLIGEKVARAYACVCVLAAEWWEGGSCICMCVLWAADWWEGGACIYMCVCSGCPSCRPTNSVKALKATRVKLSSPANAVCWCWCRGGGGATVDLRPVRQRQVEPAVGSCGSELLQSGHTHTRAHTHTHTHTHPFNGLLYLSGTVIAPVYIDITADIITHTHTHPFNIPFSGTTRVGW